MRGIAMKHWPTTARRRGYGLHWQARLVASVSAMTLAAFAAATAGAQEALAPPREPVMRDQKAELATKITQPFTVVGVGDMLHMIPISKNSDPDIQYLMNIMRSADMTIADNENTVVDHTTYRGPLAHMEAPAVMADDWANMGIKMMTKANNHTWDGGDEGVWQDFHELDRVGIVHVGVDYNLVEARQARYAATPKGTVAMVGVYSDNGRQILGMPISTVSVTAPQLAQLQAMRDSIVARRNEVPEPIAVPSDPPGSVVVFGLRFATSAPDPNAGSEMEQRVRDSERRRGVIKTKSNTINLTTWYGVTAPQMAQLRAIAGDKGQSSGQTLIAWGQHFRVTSGPGEYHYDMDPQDERDVLREIRTGKQDSDLEIATIHWHQNRFAFQHYSFDHYPADFEIKFAHDAVDQGADVFVGHGVHTIKGVEIYKGKPIFYGVSNFALMEQRFLSWRDRGALPPTPLTGPIVGEGENNEKSWYWMEQSPNLEALLSWSHFENGKLTEVRIYPVDLGYEKDGHLRPGSQVGIPKRPSPEVARQILTQVQEYSKPFGTRIDIVDGVGVIRIPPDQQR
jgi:poly-gamma-glutamate capsule biosynthesis protein CapA/YwtB (metallophosphatase superfamily)